MKSLSDGEGSRSVLPYPGDRPQGCLPETSGVAVGAVTARDGHSSGNSTPKYGPSLQSNLSPNCLFLSLFKGLLKNDTCLQLVAISSRKEHRLEGGGMWHLEEPGPGRQGLGLSTGLGTAHSVTLDTSQHLQPQLPSNLTTSGL